MSHKPKMPVMLADIMRQAVEPEDPTKAATDYRRGWNNALEAAKLTVNRPDLKKRRDIVKELDGLREGCSDKDYF